MSKQLLISIILLFFSANALSQTQKATETSNQQTLKELTRITTEIYDAYIKQDKSIIEKYFAENYLETDATCTLRDKAWNLENLLPKEQKLTYKIEQTQVREYENIAVLYYLWNVEFEANEKKSKGQIRVTDTFVRTKNGWQIISSHRTRLTDKEDLEKQLRDGARCPTTQWT